MRKLSGIMIPLVLLAAATSIGGCICSSDILPFGGPGPAPTLEPAPTVAPTPTPMPTATPSPIIITKQQSSDVKIIPYPDYKGFSWEKTLNGQSENVTVVVANNGIVTAEKVIIILKVVDAQRGETLVIHEENIGDLERGERKWVSIVTPVHSGASSVNVEARIEWGEYREFYNPDVFIRKTYSVYT